MSNQEIIVRLAFKRGSNQIHVGFTSSNNVTLTGEVVWSTDLEVSTYQTITTLNSENAIGKVAILCLSSENYAETIVDQINSIQEARPTNTRGNKYPFIFVKVRITDDVIFNQGLNNDPDRLTILGVEHAEVSAEAPSELLDLNKIKVNLDNKRVINNRPQNTISWYDRKRSSSFIAPSSAPISDRSSVRRSGDGSSSDPQPRPLQRMSTVTSNHNSQNGKGKLTESIPF